MSAHVCDAARVPGSGQPLPYPRVQPLGWRAGDPARWVSEARARRNSCGFYTSDTGAYLPRSRHLRQSSPRGQGVGGQTLSLLSGSTGLCGPAWELQPRPGQPPTAISSDSNFSFSLSLSPHLLPCPWVKGKCLGPEGQLGLGDKSLVGLAHGTDLGAGESESGPAVMERHEGCPASASTAVSLTTCTRPVLEAQAKLQDAHLERVRFLLTPGLPLIR